MSIAARLWLNELAAWAALGRAPGADAVYKVERHDGFLTAWWQKEPCGIENNVLVEPGCTDPERVCAVAAAGARESGAPTWIRGLFGSGLARWQEVAELHGFAYVGLQDKLMAAPLASLWSREPREAEDRRLSATEPGAEDERLAVRELKTEPEWLAALSVTSNVYGDPSGLTLFYCPPGVARLFAVEQGGEMLATASLWAFTDVAGIYSVATTERARGRGLASAVLRQMMAVAAAEGHEWAVLRTYGDLQAFYERLGFELVGRLGRFVYEPKGTSL
jgi:GNAT superfamily N-acetyltransferase